MTEAAIYTATATAPTNIAVVKYWGKRDTKLNLPINSSISVTLDQSDLRTVTSAAASKSFTHDRVWLNGKEEDVASNKRLVTVFREMRARANDKKDASGKTIVSQSDWQNEYKIHIVSTNSFPTAAGLASSASGYACLTKVLAELLCVDIPVSDVARMGSGSASRSLYGGYVKWDMGVKEDGSDSIASQVLPESQWPNMNALICVVSDHKKTTSSTGGMIDSVNTSDLLAHRAANIVPKRMKDMEKAILEKDFPTFAELTMKDSNSFHATCLDTYPPIKYLSDTSHAVQRKVHEVNKKAGKTICAYTYDAGPNAVIFLEDQHVTTVLPQLLDCFGPKEGGDEVFVKGKTTLSHSDCLATHPVVEGEGNRGEVKYIIHTQVGPGALIVPETDEVTPLVDASTGLPKA